MLRFCPAPKPRCSHPDWVNRKRLSRQYNREETNLPFPDGVYREGANGWVYGKEKDRTELTGKQTRTEMFQVGRQSVDRLTWFGLHGLAAGGELKAFPTTTLNIMSRAQQNGMIRKKPPTSNILYWGAPAIAFFYCFLLLSPLGGTKSAQALGSTVGHQPTISTEMGGAEGRSQIQFLSLPE